MSARDVMLVGSTYVFPLIAFPLLVLAWAATTGGAWSFVALVMGVPLVFGYFVGWMATTVTGRWRFTSGLRWSAGYVHHGFIYSAKMGFVLLLAAYDPARLDTPWEVLAAVALAGAATALGGWWHDIHAIRAGKVELVGGEEALSSFAPPSYFVIGATYAALAIGAYSRLSSDPGAILWVFPAALAILCVVPSIALMAVDERARQLFRSRFRQEVRD